MGIKSLQDYIETHCSSACVSVDLLQISRGYLAKRRGAFPASNRFCIVLDAESCLDRLYGGFFSDWVCGGQWNRMVAFISSLAQAVYNANMELVVLFNGCLEGQKMTDWHADQVGQRKKVQMVFRHLNNKGTPPPKIWWTPPVFLRSGLRMALRHLGVTIGCSMDDHNQEIIGYCREYDLQGILAQDPHHIIFEPPRYFSANNLKLTYKGSLETKEYIVDEVAKCLNLNPNRFCVFAALLGNHILLEEDLHGFFKELMATAKIDDGKTPPTKPTPEMVIKAVLDYVRAMPSVDNLDTIADAIFKNYKSNVAELVSHFKQSVQYYINGTPDGFLKYTKPKLRGNRQNNSRQKSGGQKKEREADGDAETALKDDEVSGYGEAPQIVIEPPVAGQQPGPTAPIVEEVIVPATGSTTGDLGNRYYSQELDNLAAGAPIVEEVIVPATGSTTGDLGNRYYSKELDKLAAGGRLVFTAPIVEEVIVPATGSTTGDLGNRYYSKELDKLAAGGDAAAAASADEARDSSPETSASAKNQNKSKTGLLNATDVTNKLPPVTHEIMHIASERHQKGLMSPWLYQVLCLGEVKIPVVLEDDMYRDLPSSIDVYRPIRQTVYSVLLNVNKLRFLHHNKLDELKKKGDMATFNREKGKTFNYTIKEWVVRRAGGYKPVCEKVMATPVEWKAPSIERLWLGQHPDDKNRRLRAFLTCMKSDSPLMLNTSYVPQPLLLLCCVLRYLLQSGPILQRQELDAFLAMSVSPLLHDVQTMQALKLPNINLRGVQLASLVMAGVETAMFANDVNGAPIPWTMCCPWLYFDGKLFHFKLLKANNNIPLIDICDGQVEQVLRVERMRQAILENIKADFARLMPGPFYGYPMGPLGPPQPLMNFRPAGHPHQYPPFYPGMHGPGNHPDMGIGKGGGRGRGILGRSPVDARGGQLEIAGVVVGSWGPNLSGRSRNSGGDHGGMSPHIMSVGGGRRGGLPPRGFPPRYARGMYTRRPMHARPGPVYTIRRGFRSPGRGFLYSRGSGLYRPGPRKQMRSPTKTKTTPSTGRGCTIETSGDSTAVVSVSQLLSGQDNAVSSSTQAVEVGVYADAESESNGNNNNRGLSEEATHVDKSARPKVNNASSSVVHNGTAELDIAA